MGKYKEVREQVSVRCQLHTYTLFASVPDALIVAVNRGVRYRVLSSLFFISQHTALNINWLNEVSNGQA